MSAFAGQGKLEAFGTKVGSYCQYLLTCLSDRAWSFSDSKEDY